MTLDWIGWENLTPNERAVGIYSGVITLGVVMAARALFGGLRLRRSKRRKRRKSRR